MPLFKDRFRRSQQAATSARVRPIFDDFHLLRMVGDFEYPRHQHTNYEMILVERGPYRCEINREELTLPNGRALIIKPGDWHQDHLRDRQRHYVLHFRLLSSQPGIPATPLFRSGVAPKEQICQGDHARDIWFMKELRREAEEAAPYSGAVQDSLLEALFWKLVRGLEASSLSETLRQLPATESRREAIIGEFMRFLGRNPNVPELAAELHMSPRHLVNQCRALFSESPARLLLRLKIRHAEELLRYRGMRVREVSEALGFTNPYHFSMAYKRLCGHSPSETTKIGDGLKLPDKNRDAHRTFP